MGVSFRINFFKSPYCKAFDYGKPTETRSGEAWPYADGQGEAATFRGRVADIASDAKGMIYCADIDNNELHMVTPGGAVSSLLLYKYPNYGVDIDGPIATARGNGVSTPDGSLVFFSTYGDDGWEHTPALR